jgi:tripartite-type tricarboxylate transporter receptor subunit TctC
MLLSGAAASAQDFPTRPITILVGVAPGGVTDLATRAYANVVAKNTGWKIVVENRPVAGGAVAATAVQNATPDGYTLLTVVGAQFASIPAMQSNPPFDPIRGFQPITLTFRLAQLLAVPADSPATTLSELLALAKKKDGGLSFGTPGAGSPAHLLGAKIALATGTPMQYVHYRGGPPMIADLVTGRLDFGLLSYIAAKPHIDDKKLKGLVIDAEKRIDQIPNVPTLIEAGLAKERVANWFGLAAPAGTPAAVVKQLNAAFVQASKDPDVIKQLEAAGAQVAVSTPEEMARLVAEEVASMTSLIAVLGLRKE